MPQTFRDLWSAIGEIERKLKTSWNGVSGRLEFRPAVVTVAAVGAVYSLDTDRLDVAVIEAPAADFTIAAPAGSPGDGEHLTVRIHSDASAHAATWNGAFRASGRGALPQPVADKTVLAEFVYDAARAGWYVASVDSAGY